MNTRKPIKVFFSPLSRRFYASASYKVLANGVVECAGEKFDVTDDIADLIRNNEVSFVERPATFGIDPPKRTPKEQEVFDAGVTQRGEAALTDVKIIRRGNHVGDARMINDMYGDQE